MVVQVTGAEDRNALRDLVDEMIVPRLAAVSGVSRVMASGGAAREITVRLDPDLCAAEGEARAHAERWLSEASELGVLPAVRLNYPDYGLDPMAAGIITQACGR